MSCPVWSPLSDLMMHIWSAQSRRYGNKSLIGVPRGRLGPPLVESGRNLAEVGRHRHLVDDDLHQEIAERFVHAKTLEEALGA